MPEGTQPSDDLLAGLLGDTPRRTVPPRPPMPPGAEGNGSAPGERAGTANDTGAPLSRREMRELAARQGAAPSAAQETPPGVAAPSSGAASISRPPSAVPAGDFAPPERARATFDSRSQESGAASAPDASAPDTARTSSSPAVMTLDELFTEEKAIIPSKTERKRNRRIGGWIALAVVVLIVGGITAGGLYVWNTYEAQIREVMGWEEPADYEAGLATGEASVTIASGDLPPAISQSLFEAGVTKTPDAFYDYLIDTAQNPVFYPGVYTLQQKMTSAAALEALANPANKLENTAQFNEGQTIEQILPTLAESLGLPLEDFQAAVADPSVYGVGASTLEGWLFPARYTFDPGVTAGDVIQTLVDRTVQAMDASGVPADQRERILIIASIIEREGRAADFDKVSRVIYNRIDQGMRLEMDSTAQYGYGEMHDGTASSSAEALEDDNAWNTYVIEGLPATPISNPGEGAIAAAMAPADGPWLYFVTWNMDTGETIFSETYEQHQAGIQQWNDWCAANDNRGC